jgi:hypothetical protein
MTDPVQSSINLAFCHALIALTQQAKQQMISSVLVLPEIVALHKAVKALDPTFEDVFHREKNRRKKALDAADLTEEKLTALFDEQIQSLRRIMQELEGMIEH